MINTSFNQVSEIFISSFSFQKIPKELILEIFSFLNFKELLSCSQVDKKDWIILANNKSLLKKIIYRDKTFNPEDWKALFGIPLENSECLKAFETLPINIGELLKGPCPIFAGKKFGESHVITWMPKNLTINSFAEMLIKNPNNTLNFHGIWQGVRTKVGDRKTKESKWIAMSKWSLDEANGLGLEQQQKILKRIEMVKFKCCKIPTTLEATVSISTALYKTGNPIFYKRYTRCLEKVSGCHVIVGFVKGVNVFNLDFYGNTNVGLASLITFL